MKLLSNIKFLWGIILVLILLNIASLGTIWLQENDAGDRLRPFPSRSQREHFLKEELNLTPAQQVQFDTLMNDFRNRIDAKIEDIRSLREELMGMMRNQEFTPEAEEIVNQIGEKQSELELLNYRHFREVMSICNDEQKQIFLETIRRAVGPHFNGPRHRPRNPENRGHRR